ncbi:MAG: DUF1934 domain-containing protein [Clostridium sp.]
MERKAVIKVQSNASVEGDELIEIVSPGTFRKEEDKFILEYDETEISGMEGTHTIITINEDTVLLERVGNVITKMKFDVKEDDISLYNTPYGILELDIDTKELDINVNDNGGEVFIKYEMCVGDQQPLNTSLKIDISVK